MKKGFLKFKKRYRAGVTIKSLAFGISVGIIVASVMWLVAKLSAQVPNYILYAAVGGGLALLLSAISYVLFLPTEKKIAKYLDKKLSLDEKVQTMVNFKDASGDMILVQREDTERILESTSLKKARSKHIWLHIILPVISCGLLVAAIIVPQKVIEPPKTPDPNFDMTTWQEQALRDLIKSVQASGLEDQPKGEVISELEMLLTRLKAATNMSGMKSSVKLAIENIHKYVYDYNTFDDISEKLQESDSKLVKDMGISIGLLNALELSAVLENERELLTAENTSTRLKNTAEAIKEALAKEEPAHEDALYTSLLSLADALEKTADEYDGYTEDEAEQELEDLFNDSDVSFTKALYTQYTNESVRSSTILRLMEIFGLTEDDIDIDPKVKTNDPSDGEEDMQPSKDPDKMNTGGLDDGEHLYGSDDVIYDPELGYVSYGEVIAKYYGDISYLIVDGTLSDELEQIINDYYALLYSGNNKKED